VNPQPSGRLSDALGYVQRKTVWIGARFYEDNSGQLDMAMAAIFMPGSNSEGKWRVRRWDFFSDLFPAPLAVNHNAGAILPEYLRSGITEKVLCLAVPESDQAM
jgi:hypothetical protein